MILHHPEDQLLLALSAGALAGGAALVVATHVELCAQCRRRVRELEALGGALFESLEPALLAPESMAHTLARIDAPVSTASDAGSSRVSKHRAAQRIHAYLPDGLPWQQALRGCSISAWRWLGPGIRWSRVGLPCDPAANVFLLRIAAGKSLPRHTHDGCELTQVLHGAFHDGHALFGAGDFGEADGSVLHQPVVQADGECVCLASVKGKVMFDSAIARALGSLVGM